MFPYRKIFEQAFTLTKLHKFLWGYGLLLCLGQMVNVGYAYLSQTQNLPAWFQNWSSHELLMWTLVVVACLWLWVYFRARAGMILAAKSLIEKHPVQPLVPFYLGRYFVSRLLGLTILLQLASLFMTVIISSPIYYLWGKGLEIRAIILSSLSLAVIFPAIFIIAYISILGSLFVVYFNLPLKPALIGSLNLIGSFWRKLLAIGLLMLGLRILFFAALGIICSPFVIFGQMAYHRGGSLLSVGLLVFAGSIIFLAVGSLFSVFQEIVWVRLFGELVKPQKFEPDEAEPVAEVAT